MVEKDPNDKTKTDWSVAEEHIGNSGEALVPMQPDRALQPVQGSLQEPQGIVASFKANKVKKQAALALMQEYYKGQLEVAKDTFEQA
ncbi:hypothetical protein MYX82_03935, partial [Acidobacteria bacterium AH-259-D05]|nr:hypothetical protein [Acidobacteria bacterium AH-259-D05]